MDEARIYQWNRLAALTRNVILFQVTFGVGAIGMLIALSSWGWWLDTERADFPHYSVWPGLACGLLSALGGLWFARRAARSTPPTSAHADSD